jgi:hypothetical protein
VKQNLIPVQVRMFCECGGEIKAIGGLWRRDEKAEWDSICHGSCAEETKQDRAYPYIEYKNGLGCAEIIELTANLAVTEGVNNESSGTEV